MFGALGDAGAVERVAVDTAQSTTAQQQEIAARLGPGDAAFDVPFSLADPAAARVVRGTIDALIRRPDGSIEVVAIRSGPSRKDEQALSLYVEAAQHLFPGAIVNGRFLNCNS